MRHLARPYVCGAIGEVVQPRLDGLLSNPPASVRPIHLSKRAALFASDSVPAWHSPGGEGWFWSPFSKGKQPQSWQDAAENGGAAGLVIEARSVTLHTCSLGLQELYTRTLDGAIYFATRIEPLLSVSQLLVHTDWPAWASILALGAPIGDTTPFQEVRRMTPASAWRATDSGIHRLSFTPVWLDPVAGEAGVNDLLQALHDEVPAMRGLRRSAVTLSGGWDSRLLGAIARSRSWRAPLAWTTSPDDGIDEDISLSKPVASALDMEHRIVVQGKNAWQEERMTVLERVQYQTWLHTWLMPLARKIHSRREPLLDGLAGGVLLKSSFVDQETTAQTSVKQRQEVLWKRLCGGRLRESAWYAPGLAAEFEQSTRQHFMEVVAGLSDHPAAMTLSVLFTRTTRAIACSPLWLFGPEVGVQLPFVRPSVLATALRVPVGAKIGGGFYRELLSKAAGTAVGGLPSTNDPGARSPASMRRQTQPDALSGMMTAIMADEKVRALLGPQLLPALKDATLRSKICSNNGPRSAFQWASMLALWRARYSSKLAPE